MHWHHGAKDFFYFPFFKGDVAAFLTKFDESGSL